MSAIQFLQWIASYAIQAALVIGVAAGLERWSSASTTKTRVWTAGVVSLLGVLAVGLLLPLDDGVLGNGSGSGRS